MIKNKVSILTLIICCMLVFAATYALFPKINNTEKTNHNTDVKVNCPAAMDQIRLKNYNYVQPLVLSNILTESESLNGMRGKVEQYISLVKESNQLEDISVYFRKLNEGEWFCINPNQSYNPASMSKILYLITYLKEAEQNPAILDKKIYFARHVSDVTQQNIKDFSLREGTSYTISALLSYMIKFSDNDATILLVQNLNKKIYKQLFIDLNISTPPDFGEYSITAIDYSKFFRILYNASYIRPSYSEIGLRLLTLSSYKDGIRKGVDSTIEVAHKFGERIYGDKAQFHEFGIVFIKDNPYLIGVMTKGANLHQLSDIVAEISRIIYKEYIPLKNS